MIDEPYRHDDHDAPLTDPWAPEERPYDAATGEVGGEDGADAGAELLAAILQTQAELQDALTNQQKQLDGLEELLNATPDGPWNWSMLDPEQRRKLWERLYEWVNWLENRYLRFLSPSKNGIPDLVTDWYRHPVAVELFTALMVAHAAAYRKKASIPSFALVEWHERCLWPTLARLEHLGLFKGAPQQGAWDGPTPRPIHHDEGRFAAWVETDTKTAGDDD